MRGCPCQAPLSPRAPRACDCRPLGGPMLLQFSSCAQRTRPTSLSVWLRAPLARAGSHEYSASHSSPAACRLSGMPESNCWGLAVHRALLPVQSRSVFSALNPGWLMLPLGMGNAPFANMQHLVAFGSCFYVGE